MTYSRESKEEAQTLGDHQQYREVSLPKPVPATVVQAIHSAAPDRIYTLLLEIVTTIPAAKALAEDRLLSAMSQSTSLKRKAYEMCKNCKSEFSVDNNHKGACVYHEGEKEADYDGGFWDDHDEECHGRIEELVDAGSEYDEGFLWSCCGEPVSAEGCIVSRHEPEEDIGKKPRHILQPILRNAQAT